MIKLKRAFAILLAVVVWTFRDIREALTDGALLILQGLVRLVSLILVPVAVVQNFQLAWRYKHVITKDTRWLPKANK